MRMFVKVEDAGGRLVWHCSYEDMEEMLHDIKILLKPCMFGSSGFRVIIG